MLSIIDSKDLGIKGNKNLNFPTDSTTIKFTPIVTYGFNNYIFPAREKIKIDTGYNNNGQISIGESKLYYIARRKTKNNEDIFKSNWTKNIESFPLDK